MNELKRFNYLVSELDNCFHEIAVQQGLTDSASKILYTLLDSNGSCPLSQILRSTGIPKQTANSALRKLEAEGTLCLQQDSGRKKSVCLTENGWRLAEMTVGQVQRMENEILESWSEAERQLYLDLTQRYLNQLKAKSKELWT